MALLFLLGGTKILEQTMFFLLHLKMIKNTNEQFEENSYIVLEIEGNVEKFRSKNPLLFVGHPPKDFKPFNMKNSTKVKDHLLQNRVFYENDQCIGFEMKLVKLCDNYYKESTFLRNILDDHNSKQYENKFYVTMPSSPNIMMKRTINEIETVQLGSWGILKRIFVNFKSPDTENVLWGLLKNFHCVFTLSYELESYGKHNISQDHQSENNMTAKRTRLFFHINLGHSKLKNNENGHSEKISIVAIIHSQENGEITEKKIVENFNLSILSDEQESKVYEIYTSKSSYQTVNKSFINARQPDEKQNAQCISISPLRVAENSFSDSIKQGEKGARQNPSKTSLQDSQPGCESSREDKRDYDHHGISPHNQKDYNGDSEIKRPEPQINDQVSSENSQKFDNFSNITKNKHERHDEFNTLEEKQKREKTNQGLEGAMGNDLKCDNRKTPGIARERSNEKIDMIKQDVEKHRCFSIRKLVSTVLNERSDQTVTEGLTHIGLSHLENHQQESNISSEKTGTKGGENFVRSYSENSNKSTERVARNNFIRSRTEKYPQELNKDSEKTRQEPKNHIGRYNLEKCRQNLNKVYEKTRQKLKNHNGQYNLEKCQQELNKSLKKTHQEERKHVDEYILEKNLKKLNKSSERTKVCNKDLYSDAEEQIMFKKHKENIRNTHQGHDKRYIINASKIKTLPNQRSLQIQKNSDIQKKDVKFQSNSLNPLNSYEKSSNNKVFQWLNNTGIYGSCGLLRV